MSAGASLQSRYLHRAVHLVGYPIGALVYPIKIVPVLPIKPTYYLVVSTKLHRSPIGGSWREVDAYR